MSEFEEKLGAILADENAMGQIMSLAQSLSAPSEPREEGCEPPLEPACPRKDEALLEALRPFLKEKRQDRLDRTLEILRLLRLMKGKL